MTGGRFAGHDPHAGHDTAGVPWAGRTLSGTGFDADTGVADPALAQALRAPGDEPALMSAVATARLLVPVVAVPRESQAPERGDTDDLGADTDVGTDMAAMTLVAPDGAKALPAFTCLESLSGWDPSARPVPVTAQRAALAAIQEGCESIVLDVGSQTTYALRPSMLWALATARAWTPSHLDSQVEAAVAAAVATEPAATSYTLGAAAGGALQITLGLRPGLSATAVQQVATRMGERLARDGEVRARIDAIAVRVREIPDGRPGGNGTSHRNQP